MNRYPRDFRGHGPNPPDAAWPGGAKIAISIVLNYEEGGENNLLHGDAQSEAFLSDIAGAAPWPGMRHWNMESIYDYGARAGFWRLHRLFTGMDIPVTIYGVTSALAGIGKAVESSANSALSTGSRLSSSMASLGDRAGQSADGAATVDLAARMSQVQYQSLRDRAKVRDFFIRYQDRLLYGTDLTVNPDTDPAEFRAAAHAVWTADWRYLATGESQRIEVLEADVAGLALPRAVIDKVYYGNAAREFKL